MTKEQEFRKQTEEAKFEAFSLMCRKVADLEAKLKHAEENCINKTCVVFKDKEDCVAKLLELEKENAELKEELKKWKDEWQEQVQKANDEGYARTLQTIQLTKAKEIIKKLISDNRKVWVYSDVREEAEQFISEVQNRKGGKDVL